jgi:hypothetical protein
MGYTLMSKDDIRQRITSLQDGGLIAVAVNPALNQECGLVVRSLGKPDCIQWITGTFIKNSTATTFFVPDSTCWRLPLTRQYRRLRGEALGKDCRKIAVFDYVLNIQSLESQ